MTFVLGCTESPEKLSHFYLQKDRLFPKSTLIVSHSGKAAERQALQNIQTQAFLGNNCTTQTGFENTDLCSQFRVILVSQWRIKDGCWKYTAAFSAGVRVWGSHIDAQEVGIRKCTFVCVHMLKLDLGMLSV